MGCFRLAHPVPGLSWTWFKEPVTVPEGSRDAHGTVAPTENLEDNKLPGQLTPWACPSSDMGLTHLPLLQGNPYVIVRMSYYM